MLHTLPGKFQISFWLEFFRSIPLTLVVLILGAGVILVLYGRVTFRLIVVLNAALIAGYIGLQLASAFGWPRMTAAVLALVVAILAWPMFKLGVAGISGLIGSFLTVWALMALVNRSEYMPVAAAAGFLLFALLGWFLLNPAIIAFTALQGSAMIVLSTLSLLDRSTVAIANVRWWAARHGAWIGVIIVALALLGVVFQGHVPKKTGQPAPGEPKQAPK